ncbi:MAG: hypothetical protein N2450_00890 [bacterium]|nr:hypothetical protein [bacterium]
MNTNFQNEKQEYRLPQELEEYLSKPLPLKLPNPKTMAQRAIQLGDRRTVKKWEIQITPILATLTLAALLESVYNWWLKLSFTIKIPVGPFLQLWDNFVISHGLIWVILAMGSMFYLAFAFFTKKNS